MILAQITCIIFIILGIAVFTIPLKIINFFRGIFSLNRLESDNFNVLFYRVGGILSIIVFALLLFQTFS